ncbi:acyltransferase family protein [Flavobacterium sp. UBA6046]|uniref:acyltransferase family protein n=1 Tax=Flavobacterium sp. UBA6046 TaxID=1946552 RepID=UPI0025BD0F4B|nr:acyltransferase [Flavobacterium sp. UBA6046]
METSKKVNSLILLRGVAVLSVALCHYGNPLSKSGYLAGMFNIFHDYGKYGVNIFFVISGFIIPLSMDKAKYTIKYYFRFLFKRAIRLHPPYLVALALTLLLVGVANRVKHIPFPETLPSIIESCFYFHIPENNPVFWTLQVEAEYYIFMGLFFVALKSSPKLTLCIAIPLIMLLSQTGIVKYISLFDYIIFFLIGAVGYMIYNKVGSYQLELACLIALIAFSFIFYALAASIAVLFTVSLILLYKGTGNRFFDFFGEISYSVYLIHFPLGVKFINLTFSHLNPRYYIFLFLFALVLMSGISMVFWKLIEKPFGDLSNKIKYGESKKSPKSLTVELLRPNP